MKLTRPLRRFALLLPLAGLFLAVGCAHGNMHPAGKVALTPLTGVRDIIDAPLVSLTNVTQFWADKSNPTPVPGAGVGWSYRGGFDFGVGMSVAYFAFQGVSWIIGGIDYVVCRSIWPNFASGVSPWKKEGEPWGNLYFPSTNALWDDEDDLDEYGEDEWTPPPPEPNPDYKYDSP